MRFEHHGGWCIIYCEADADISCKNPPYYNSNERGRENSDPPTHERRGDDSHRADVTSPHVELRRSEQIMTTT